VLAALRPLIGAAVVVTIVACGQSEPPPTDASVSSGAAVKVAFFARNGLVREVWFAVPDEGPPGAWPAVGIQGSGAGLACFAPAAGSKVALLTANPATPGTQIVRVVAEMGTDPVQAIWVDLAADGSSTSGSGRPLWWPAFDPGTC
jgi:hypothetical protein